MLKVNGDELAGEDGKINWNFIKIGEKLNLNIWKKGNNGRIYTYGNVEEMVILNNDGGWIKAIKAYMIMLNCIK